MTNEHLITPPPELMHQWVDMLSSRSDQAVFTMAAQWGADQELEACCELTRDNEGYDAALRLRGSRRPKPPTLKEQALERLELAKKYVDVEPIFRAIEQLPDAL
jgi:hypothetical protein